MFLRSTLPFLETSTPGGSRITPHILSIQHISTRIQKHSSPSTFPRDSRHQEYTRKNNDGERSSFRRGKDRYSSNKGKYKEVTQRGSNSFAGRGDRNFRPDGKDFGQSEPRASKTNFRDTNHATSYTQRHADASEGRLAGDKRGRDDRNRHGKNADPDSGPDESKFRKKVILRDGKRIKLLTPVVLSARMTNLCEKGELNEAITLVKESPLDAQNSVVWANLIRYVLKEKKYQEAYRLFTDMKRRGIRPTLRTYGTFLKGYTRIEDWDGFSLQLNNVSSLYDQLMRHVEIIKENRESTEELSNIPFNLLIEIFGKAQDFQRMYDVLNAMPSKGPLAPDLFTFTALLNAVAGRTLAGLSKANVQDENTSGVVADEAEAPSRIELAYKNAADARLIWKQLIRTCGAPDEHSLRAVFVPLSRGRPSDQNIILDIAQEFLGLSRPGERSLPSKMTLHPQALNILLSTCNRASRYRFTIHYIEQIIDTQRASMLATEHMDLAIEAHTALASSDSGESGQALDMLEWMLRMSALPVAHIPESGLGPKIKPEQSTYDLVALACYYGGDWRSICRTFELMTGHSRDDFRDTVPNQLLKKSRIVPSGSFMACFIRTACKTTDVVNSKMALNALQYYEPDLISLFDKQPQDESVPRRQQTEKFVHANRLAEGLVAILPQVIKSAEYDEKTKALCSTWLKHAKALKDSVPRKGR